MPLLRARATLASLIAVLAALVCAVAAPAAVPPTESVGTGTQTWGGGPKWNEGTVQNVSTYDCLVPPGSTTQLGGSWLSWWGTQGSSPTVNEVYYVRISWFQSGFPCGTGSSYVAPEITLPQATSFSISAETPVRCFVKFDGRAWQEFARGTECPQAPTGTGQKGGHSFNPASGEGAWPTSYGAAFEIWIPVKTTQNLNNAPGGNASCANCFNAAVLWIDGVDNPWAYPKVFVPMGNGTAPPGPYVQYVPPISHQAPCPAGGQGNTSVPDTYTTGEVYTQGTTGNAYVDIGFAGSPYAARGPAIAINQAGGWRASQCWSDLAPGNYHFRLCYDPAGATPEVCGGDQAFTVPGAADGTAPNTEIVKKPPNPSDGREDTFTFKSTEPNSTFQCSLNGGEFKPCLVLALKDLATGDYTLAVRARDAAGNVDPTPATYAWHVDRPVQQNPGGGTGDPGSGTGDPGGGTGDPGGGTTPPKQCVVPKLKGKSLKSAKAALKKANCKLGKVTYRKVARKAKPGLVISSSPKAKKTLKAGAKVALVVGKR